MLKGKKFKTFKNQKDDFLFEWLLNHYLLLSVYKEGAILLNLIFSDEDKLWKEDLKEIQLDFGSFLESCRKWKHYAATQLFDK